MQDLWLVIVNPVSGGKRAPKRWAKIQPVLEQAGIPFQVQITEYRDHGAALVREALQAGVRKCMIVGGDGTANDVINGVYTSGIDPATVMLAMVPAGTGNDWVRTIGSPVSAQQIMNSLLRAHYRLHDVGVLQCKGDGKPVTRYFINIAGLGFEGAVAKRLYDQHGSWYLGKLQYQVAIMRSLFVYKHTRMELQIDDSKVQETVLSIALGNGKFNGGGLMQLPAADPGDGMLDITVITTMPKWKMVVSLPKLKTGVHTRMREVKTYTGRMISIHSNPPVCIDSDGEYVGVTPLQCTIAEKQVKVLIWQ